MKSFVRDIVPVVAVTVVVTLSITALAGGSETVFYLSALACLAVGLWREIRRGAL